MVGVRILVFTCAAFALLCVAGFVLLDQRAHPGVAGSPERTLAPPQPASLAARPAPDDRSAPSREVLPPPIEATANGERDADAAPERDPTWTGRVITAPGSRWIRETEREAHRLLSLCMETDGHQVAGPVEIEVELTYAPDDAEGPSRRRAVASVQDPYLQACASDSLLDLAYPDPGGPAEFQHRATFRWPSP